MVPVVLPVKALVDLPVTERPFGALQEVLVVLEPWTSSWAVHSSSGAGSNWRVGNIELRTKEKRKFFLQKRNKKLSLNFDLLVKLAGLSNRWRKQRQAKY